MGGPFAVKKLVIDGQIIDIPSNPANGQALAYDSGDLSWVEVAQSGADISIFNNDVGYTTTSEVSTSYVPYSGAASDVDLGANDILQDGGVVKNDGVKVYSSGDTASYQIELNRYHLRLPRDGRIEFGLNQTNTNGGTATAIYCDDDGVVSIRNGTDAQSLCLSNSYTSNLDKECFFLKSDTTDYKIGSLVGLTGGDNKDIVFGHWAADETFTRALVVDTEGDIQSSGNLFIQDGLTLFDGTPTVTANTLYYDSDLYFSGSRILTSGDNISLLNNDSGYVPYSGAVDDVDLGSNTLLAGSLSVTGRIGSPSGTTTTVMPLGGNADVNVSSSGNGIISLKRDGATVAQVANDGVTITNTKYLRWGTDLYLYNDSGI